MACWLEPLEPQVSIIGDKRATAMADASEIHADQEPRKTMEQSELRRARPSLNLLN